MGVEQLCRNLDVSIFSISTNLPSTAYIKMIDIWLILSLLKPFVDIIVQTYIETLRDNTDDQKDYSDEEKKTAWGPNDKKVNMDELK